MVIAMLIASAVAGSRLAQSLPALRSIRLDVGIFSPTSFLQEVPRTSGLTVVHADGTRELLESRMYGAAFVNQHSTAYFNIADPKATQFYLSPAPSGELVAITRLQAVTLNTRRKIDIPLGNLRPIQQVQVLDRLPDRLVLRTLPGDASPLLGFELPPRPPATPGSCLAAGIDAALFFGATFLAVLAGVFAVRRTRHGGAPFRFQSTMLGLALAAAFALICMMSLGSRFNAHPDEYLHFEAGNYFVSHWLPPSFDDPSVEPSFSHYGLSYLQNLDAAYFAMGKFMAVFSPSVADRETTARLFNCLLFLAVAGWLFHRLGRSWAPAILIVTPQAWYIFSYINSDAWALALSLVIIGMLVDESSLVSRYFSDRERVGVAGGVVLGVLLALLLMAKHNYYLLFGFVALIVLWKAMVWSDPMPWSLFIRKTAVVVATVAAVYLPILLTQEWTNHFQLERTRIEQAEKFAAPGFKPTAIAAGKTAAPLALRERGVTFATLIFSYWPAQSFRSFCGVYHWMDLLSPYFYYVSMAGLYIALAIVAGFGFRRLSRADLLFCGLTFLLAVGMVLLSAYNSWAVDYQPQGRYLFPILPMVAFVLHHYRGQMPAKALNVLFAALFGLSTFSFVFIGLRYFYS